MFTQTPKLRAEWELQHEFSACSQLSCSSLARWRTLFLPSKESRNLSSRLEIRGRKKPRGVGLVKQGRCKGAWEAYEKFEKPHQSLLVQASRIEEPSICNTSAIPKFLGARIQSVTLKYWTQQIEMRWDTELLQRCVLRKPRIVNKKSHVFEVGENAIEIKLSFYWAVDLIWFGLIRFDSIGCLTLTPSPFFSWFYHFASLLSPLFDFLRAACLKCILWQLFKDYNTKSVMGA